MKVKETGALTVMVTVPSVVDTIDKVDKWIDIFIEDYIKEPIAVFDVICFSFHLETEIDYCDCGFGDDYIYVALTRDKNLEWTERYRGDEYPEAVQFVM